MNETDDVSRYFRGRRLLPGTDFTHNRTMLKAVILEWLRRHPGPQQMVFVKDGVNCGDAALFDKLIAELARTKLIKLHGNPLLPIVTLYSHVSVSAGEWLRYAAREQAAREVCDGE